MTAATLIVASAAAGACLGSFIGTTVMRLLRAEQPWCGASHCDHCGAALSFITTVPIASFVARAGACSTCGGDIHPIHPVSELSGALIGALPFLVLDPAPAILVAALGFVLLAASLVDSQSLRLPDVLTAGCLALSIILSAAHGWPSLAVGGVSALMAFAVLQVLRLGFERVAGEVGLGFGDVKLTAALAVWLGSATSWAILSAAVLGLVYVMARGKRRQAIAFGPFIASAGWLVGLGEEAHWWPSLI